MNFSYAKTITLAPQKEKKLSTFLIALLSATIIFLPFIIMSKGYFIFFGDFNVQQIPFYQMCHQMVKTGNIKWNWLTDLGSDFIGSYGFYLLGSPFFWLTIPFPNSFVPYLMGPLLILKFACAAFTAYLYIRRFTRTPQAAQLGALLYAFSGFSVYNIFFNHFHESIICFPLLLLALEMLITENKRGVFALTVALCAFVNYFFFFGMVVFAVLYFFVRLFSGAVRVRFSRFLVILFEAVLGLLMSAVLLLPCLMAILGMSRVSNILLGWSAIMYGKEQIYLNVIECFFFPPDLPARPVFFPEANVKWSSLGGWLPLFGMTGVFTLFIEKKKSWLKRIIGICIFMSLVPILNSAFYAFNTAYYARWFYMPILMMCLGTAHLLEDTTVEFNSGFKWTFGITLAFGLVIGLFPQYNEKKELVFGLYTQSEDNSYLIRFWYAVIMAVVSLAVLYFILKIRKENLKKFFKVATAFVCICSVIYASVFVFTGRLHSYDIKETMIDGLIEGEVYLDDDSSFRIDTYDGVDNTGMYLGLSSINAFHSIVPSSITDFYNYIGIERGVGSRPDTSVPAIRSLLSVKYLLNRVDGESFLDEDNESKMPGYSYLKTSGGYYVYENNNYIPYGFSYDYYMTEDYIKDYSGDAKSRMMLKAILLNENQIKKYSDILTDIEELEEALYKETEITKETKAVDETDNTEISENTEEINGLEEQINENAVTLELDDDALQNDAMLLAATSAKSFKTTNDGFIATVKRDSRSLVFFSVPYDSGWTATVNGKAVEIEKVNVGFMAVVVPSGTSEIEFRYETPYLQLGIYISIAAFTIFLIYFLIATAFVKKHPSNNEYPEGKALIEKWRKDDIAEMTSESLADSFDDDLDFGLPDKLSIDNIKAQIEKENGDTVNGFVINTDAFKENNDS